MLRLGDPLHPHVGDCLYLFLPKLDIVLRVLWELVFRIMLNHKVFAIGSLLKGIVYKALMIARRKISSEHEEVQSVDIVSGNVRQVDCLHISQLIVVDHVIDDALPSQETSVQAELFDYLLCVVPKKLHRTFFDLINHLNVFGKAFSLTNC